MKPVQSLQTFPGGGPFRVLPGLLFRATLLWLEWRWLGAIGLGACVAALSGCARPADHAAAVEMPATPQVERDNIRFPTNALQLAYLTVEPARQQTTAVTGVTGRLAWDDDVTARVFSAVSGRIVEILANPGQKVSAGAPLARVRSPDFGQAQADARKAEADLAQAQRALKRARDLLQHGAAAEKDVESAETDYARAASEQARALATLSVYGGQGELVDGLFTLRSPVSGVVVDKSVNPGQEVRGDQLGDKPLFVISDPTRLWLFLDVSESDAETLRAGREVLVHGRALPDRVFHGQVAVVGEGLDPATRNLRVRCTVDNAEKLLRAEMYVSADLPTATAAVELPTEALFSKDKQHYVFLEVAPGQFQRRAVTVGMEREGRSVVLEGLASGQRVVTRGSLLLQAVLEGDNS